MTITFQPTARQFEAWEALTDKKTTEIGYGGGAGGGKSFLGCFWLLSMCLAYPGTRWVMGRKELVNLKRTTLNTFFEVCDRYKVQAGKAFSYNQQTNTLHFLNGSQILLFDLSSQPSDPLYTRLGSLELTGAFVDESNEVEEKALTTLRTRVGRCKNVELNITPKVLETFNPSKGHVFLRFYKPFKNKTMPSYRTFIRALLSDNPHLGETYLSQLMHTDKVTIERLVHGNFEYDDDPSAMIEYDAIMDLLTNSVDPGDKYISCDVARFGQDSTVIYLWEGLRVTKVMRNSKQGTEVTAGLLKQLSHQERVPFSKIVIDEDGIGGGVVDQLKGVKGFIANSSPFPSTTTYQDENFDNLKAQCYAKLANLINERKVAISTDDGEFFDKLSEELGVIKRKNMDDDKTFKIISKDDMKRLLGRSPDHADALMMRMLFEVAPSLSRVGQQAIQTRPSSTQAYRRHSPTPSKAVLSQ